MKKKYLRFSLAMLVTGVGTGFFSFALHYSIDEATSLLGTLNKFQFRTFLFSAVFAFLSYYLTKKVFSETGGSGIPQVKLNLVAFKGRMQKRLSFGKFITSFLTLASGLPFGKEGPMVTISASWGHLVAYYLRLDRQTTKVVVSSGASAGLAAAFNTPIAAVVFTIEEVLGELNTKYLGPIIVTAVIASVTSYKLLGNQSVFKQLNYGFDNEWHLVLYLLLGATLSLVGYVFVKAILMFKGIKKRYFTRFDSVYVLLAVALAALFSQIRPEILGDGAFTINRLLTGEWGHEYIPFLVTLLVLKLVLVSFSYSTGLSGGLFMPVLFLGALGGTLFGEVLQQLGFENIQIGIFALLGMTSLLVAVIKAPFTAFIMLFELTRDYDIILPLMVSSIGAYWVSSLFNQESVYESVAEYEGVHLPTQKDNECMNEMTVQDCMLRDLFTLQGNQTVEEVLSAIEDNDFSGFPVLRGDTLIGVVNRSELRRAAEEDPKTKVRNAAKYSVISIYPDQSLLVAMDKMKRFEIGRLPVVSRFNDRKLLGMITPRDIVNYLAKNEYGASEPLSILPKSVY